MLQPLTLFLQRWKAEVFPTAEVPKGKFPPEYAFQHLVFLVSCTHLFQLGAWGCICMLHRLQCILNMICNCVCQ